VSGGANKAFLADPVSWMRTNLLIVALQETMSAPTDDAKIATGLKAAPKYRDGDVVSCDITVHPTDTAVAHGGGGRKAYIVKAASGVAHKHSHRFNAYYLPFFNNDFRTMRLDSTQFPPGADVFFTDSVNGCSFAAGPGANPKVGHFNRTSGPQQAADQNAMDHDIGMEFAGGTVVKLTKATYKGASISKAATVFGFRQGGGTWSFYWQPRDIVSYNHPTGTKWEMSNPAVVRCDNNG
jgi:hypothetical protein